MKRAMVLIAGVAASAIALGNEIDNGGSNAPSAAMAATVFTDFTDFGTWQAAFGGPITRVGFSELAPGTVVTGQYASEGATFTDGDDTVLLDELFVEDGTGLRGAGRIHVALSQPAVAVGAFFPGAMTIEVYESEGAPALHTSDDFGGSGGGHFGGIVSDTPFGFIEIRDWVDDSVFIDDLVIGFAPPEGAVTGCIEVTGIKLALNPVLLLQKDEVPQLALTDANGCYRFESAVSGKWFSILIVGTVAP
ncbi:MAG: hypothetical protein H6983_07740 [Ectothiorhodospiraceae bacterium]|nr:hypothetical protein [Chromatiales bacterium]MCP5154038.1 hypothetical protein [Ectothiorhodospiraceae bacterium]